MIVHYFCRSWFVRKTQKKNPLIFLQWYCIWWLHIKIRYLIANTISIKYCIFVKLKLNTAQSAVIHHVPAILKYHQSVNFHLFMLVSLYCCMKGVDVEQIFYISLEQAEGFNKLNITCVSDMCTISTSNCIGWTSSYCYSCTICTYWLHHLHILSTLTTKFLEIAVQE